MFMFHNITLEEYSYGPHSFTCAEELVATPMPRNYHNILISDHNPINNINLDGLNKFWNSLWINDFYNITTNYNNISAKMLISSIPSIPPTYYYQFRIISDTYPIRMYKNFAVRHLYFVLLRHFLGYTNMWPYSFSITGVKDRTKEYGLYFEAIEPFTVEDGNCYGCGNDECEGCYLDSDLEVNGFETYLGFYHAQPDAFKNHVRKPLLSREDYKRWKAKQS